MSWICKSENEKIISVIFSHINYYLEFNTDRHHFSLDMLSDIFRESVTMDRNWIVMLVASEMLADSMQPLHFQRHLLTMRALFRWANNSMVRFRHQNCVTASTDTSFPILLIWNMMTMDKLIRSTILICVSFVWNSSEALVCSQSID